MGRSSCCSKEQGLNRGAWTAAEDKILWDYIDTHGQGKWRHIPNKAGLNRCGKSCRLRWLNYLRPDIKRGNITHDEEDLIIRLHKLLGNRWSLIAGRLPGRTDNEIKNYLNTIIGKKIYSQPSTVVRRSTSGCDQSTVNRSCSLNAQAQATVDHNRNYQNATVDSDHKNIIPVPENFMMDFDIDKDFISDILKGQEFSHLNLDQTGSFEVTDQLDWLIHLE